MKFNFVVFYSPGKNVDEEVAFSIDEWDYEKALYMARSLIEEGICIPFAFNFESRIYNDFGDFCQDNNEFSSTYHLGGEILTRQDILNDENLELLIKMFKNDLQRVIVNTNYNPFIIKPFRDNDIILDFHV